MYWSSKCNEAGACPFVPMGYQTGDGFAHILKEDWKVNRTYSIPAYC